MKPMWKWWKSAHSHYFIFSTYFLDSLKTSGYEQNRRWTKEENIFSKEYVLFPLHENNHWFLGVFENKTRDLLNSQVREQLKEAGIYLKDGKEGTTFSLNIWTNSSTHNLNLNLEWEIY